MENNLRSLWLTFPYWMIYFEWEVFIYSLYCIAYCMLSKTMYRLLGAVTVDGQFSLFCCAWQRGPSWWQYEYSYTLKYLVMSKITHPCTSPCSVPREFNVEDYILSELTKMEKHLTRQLLLSLHSLLSFSRSTVHSMMVYIAESLTIGCALVFMNALWDTLSPLHRA